MSAKFSLLWELSTREAPGPSFLFGTMHIRDRRAFHGMATVQACVNTCQALALEIDLDEGNTWSDPSALRLPDQTSLRDYLSAQGYSRLQKILLKAFGFNLNYFSFLTPMALMEFISEQIMQKDHHLFLDAFLWEYATARGMATFGIESLESQQQLLARIPLDMQLKMLKGLGRNPEHYRALLNHLVRLYEEGDLPNLYRVSRKSAGGLRKWMLYDRNAVMADRLASLLPHQRIFCGVGAAHLWGGKGILRLLKQKGVKIRPIPLNSSAEKR